jgi:hypothetical protein
MLGDIIEIVTPVRIFFLVSPTEETEAWLEALSSWIGESTGAAV